MLLTKPHTIRLTGKTLRRLYEYIYQRDNHKCIVCGKWVSDGEIPHHEPCGRYKEDVPEKMCLVCYGCHQQRESKGGESVKQTCIDYLDQMYPDRRNKYQIPN